jgi:hypothetical protein
VLGNVDGRGRVGTPAPVDERLAATGPQAGVDDDVPADAIG